MVVLVSLGLWQLRRLDGRRDANAAIRSRIETPVVPLDTLTAPGDDAGVASTIAYRQVRAEGRYDPDQQIVVSGRSLGGRPGIWVLTPLVVPDGTAIVVNRGFFPSQGVPAELPAEAAPPAGQVTVEGSAMATQRRGSIGPSDPSEGRLTDLARVDLERLEAQVPYEVWPVWISLREQAPAQASGLPVPLPPVELDDGPHLSYAVQWFIFATIAIIGYPLILRRQARSRAPDLPSEDARAA